MSQSKELHLTSFSIAFALGVPQHTPGSVKSRPVLSYSCLMCVCAQLRGTSETLGSDVPQGGPKSVALFQSGLVSPVTLYLHTHTHTHTHIHAAASQ